MSQNSPVYKGLLEDEALMANLIQSLMDVLLVIDRDASIRFISRAGEELLGYRAQDLIGQPIGTIISDENLQFFKAVRELMTTGESRHCDVWMMTRSGEKIPATFNGSVLRDSNRKIQAVVGVIRDMREFWRLIRELEEAKSSLEEKVQARTAELAEAKSNVERAYEDLKLAQAQLVQAEKLSSLGQLAAGVAHEINNPIGFVSSNLGTLKEYFEDILQLLRGYDALLTMMDRSDPVAIDAEKKRVRVLAKQINIDFLLNDVSTLTAQSLDGMDRVRRIVQDLKEFSHVDRAERMRFNLNQGIESTLNIVWNELKYKAEVVKELGEIPEIMCYPQQINQVFMNLLVNAAQAMNEKGKIWIRSFVSGDQVAVEIEDSGCGIPEENLKKIFDPFFTTKPVGKGTGLGLSMSYGTVQKHGGKIEVESTVGKGTKFRVLLPIATR
jgi:PAS domain S-box-containing protein